MRMHNRKVVVAGGRVSALGALVVATGLVACSSDDGGGGNGNVPPPFGVGNGNAPSAGGGAGGATTTPGLGAGGGGAPGVDVNQPGVIDGNAGSAGAAAVPAGPVEDVIAEPGPGYFTTGAWQGYAWTAIESDPVQGQTTRTPVDFTTLPDGEPFCLTGTVAADPPSSPTANDGYQGFAMLGFNLNQAGVPDVPGTEPPIQTVTPTAEGLAFTFQLNTGNLRVQIQGLNPADPAQRWCASVAPPDAQGRGFIPWSSFHQTCYDPTAVAANPAGFYGAGGARPPIAALSFQVPGDIVPTPFDFCVDGFADGASIADAPASISGGGLISGTLATNFGRAKVRGRDGKTYVVQNNAWNGGAVEGNHRIAFSGNSFTVTQQSNGGFGNIPISFPSIFVGRNGFRGANDLFTTTEDDNLPRAINQLTSIQSTFSHNGGQGPQGEYNVTYDIWFANSPPQGEYDDASAAFLMVWLYKPAGKNPIGLNPFVRGVSIAGAPGTWDIWVGRRGENGAEDNLNDNAPVISYTPSATIPNFNANLLAFINDAVQRSSAGQLNGFQFPGNLVLTDIFGGMEIWSGGQGLQVTDFTVNVQ